MPSICRSCGQGLNRYNPGPFCYHCQEKRREELPVHQDLYYDAQDMVHILGLWSEEQVKRLARKGKLPPRVPAVRKWLWDKEVVRHWIKGEGQLPPGSAKQLAALADAHGGVHFDEAAGCWKVGKPEEISVVVADRNGSRIEKYTEFIPGHHDSH